MGGLYISVDELSVGFSEHVLPATSCLAGTRTELHCRSGKRVSLNFISGESLEWATTDRDGPDKRICSYRAIAPREEIYFIDFITADGDSKSVSIVLDMARGCATVVTGILPTAEEVMIPLIVRAEKRMPLTSVQAIFEHAAIDRPFSDATPCHERSGDLVGERIQWVYSSKNAYEHVYLAENTYSWHCIAGNEKGLADTDRCFCRKITEGLYLFVWVEKIIPTVGVVLEDLDAMRSCGKIFGRVGYDMTGGVTNFPVGAYGTLLNKTQYDFSRLLV
jgi:hypothetical protein